MGKNKDYSTGNAKRWAVVFGIIVLVAIVVVVIIMAIPPNTYNAIQTLNRTATTSYLTVNSEKVAFDEFKAKINSSSVNGYSVELNDVEGIVNTIDIVLDYHNQYLVFAKDNENLKNNYKAIREGLNAAKSNQKKLVKIVEKTNKLSSTSISYLQGAMVDYREAFVKYLKASRRALRGLENAYTGSLGNVAFNNKASATILNVINDYMTVLVEDFKALEKTDVKGGSMSTYATKYSELAINAKATYLQTFVNKNLLGLDIDNYYYDTTIEEKYEKVNEFYTVYTVKDTVELIASINSSGVVEKKYDGVSDPNSTYDAMCNYIKGGY